MCGLMSLALALMLMTSMAPPATATPLDVDLGQLCLLRTNSTSAAECSLSQLCPFDGTWAPPAAGAEPPRGSWAGVRVLRGVVTLLSTAPMAVLLNGSVVVTLTPRPPLQPGTTVQWLVADAVAAPGLPLRTTVFVAAFVYVGNGSRGDPGVPPDKEALLTDALANPGVLMLSIGFRDNAGLPAPPLVDEATAWDTMFDQPDSVAALYVDSSQGGIRFNRSASTYAHVQTGHSTFTAACDFVAWARDALAAYTAAGGRPDDYLVKLYLLPPDAGSGVCGWLGIAFVGCVTLCNAWVRTPSAAAWTHELGHVYGLGHSSLDADNDGVADPGIPGAYGDWSDPMGNGDRQVRFSAVHRYMLGVLPPAVVTSASSYTASTYTLTTASIDAPPGATQLLRVPSTVTSEPPYWFSLRTHTPTGFDGALGANWAPAVYAHRANAASPATPTLLVWRSSTDSTRYVHTPSGMDVAVAVTPPTATLWFRVCSRRGVVLSPLAGTTLLRVTNLDEFCPPSDYLVFVSQLVNASAPFCGTATITLVPDNFPREMSFELRNTAGSLLLSGGVGTYEQRLCAPVTTLFTANFIDTGHDGYCCFSGQGSYTLLLEDRVVAAGGAFGYVESVPFMLAPQWRVGPLDAGATEVIDLGAYAGIVAAVTARDGAGANVTIAVQFSASRTPVPSASKTASVTGSRSTTPVPSASSTKTASRSASPSVSRTPTNSPVPSSTASASRQRTSMAPTASATPTRRSVTPTASATPTRRSASLSASATPTRRSASATPTRRSASLSASATPTWRSASATPTRRSASLSASATPTQRSASLSASATRSATASRSQTVSRSRFLSLSPSPSKVSPTPTTSRTPTRTSTGTRSRTSSRSLPTATKTASKTPPPSQRVRRNNQV